MAKTMRPMILFSLMIIPCPSWTKPRCPRYILRSNIRLRNFSKLTQKVFKDNGCSLIVDVEI